MKSLKALTAAAVAVALVVPLGGSPVGAVATTSLTIVDGAQYDINNLMDHTVCIDGVVAHDSTSLTSGIATTPGTHTIMVNDREDGCTVGGHTIVGTVQLLDTAAQSLVINVPEWNENTPVLSTTLFADDVSCTAPGTARVMFRNVASADGAVAILGSIDGGVKTPLISNLAAGQEGVASIPAGTFPNPPATLAAWDANIDRDYAMDGTSLAGAPGSVTLLFAIAGLDGVIGVTGVEMPGSVCASSVTTVTSPTTTTVAGSGTGARAATPVASQPRYTG